MKSQACFFLFKKKKTKTFLKFLFFQKEFNLRFSLFFVTVIFYVTSDRPNVRDENDGTSLDRRSNIELDPPQKQTRSKRILLLLLLYLNLFLYVFL